MNLTEKINILWVDDEIDLLKPHIIFLEEKGYRLITANNGSLAIDLVDEEHFDLVFLDENMPRFNRLRNLSSYKKQASKFANCHDH